MTPPVYSTMIQARIPEAMHHRLRKVSQEQHRSLRAVCQEALEKYLAWYDWVQAQEKEGKNSAWQVATHAVE